MMQKLFRYTALFLILASCSATKYLTPDEKFFEGYEIEYVEREDEVPGDVKNSLLSDIGPDPTRRFFLSRPGTWIYYQIDTVQKQKGLKYFIKYRLGNQPSMLEEVRIVENQEIIRSRIRAAGFFRAEVEHEIDSTENRASVIYRIQPNEPYYFDSLQISSKPHPWSSELRRVYREKTVIKEGNLFRKNSLVSQRTAIADVLNNEGYFYFTPSLLYYRADSSENNRNVRVSLDLKENTPQAAIEKFRIDSITVDLSANSQNTEVIGDSLRTIVDKDRLFIKPEKLNPFIIMEPGALYNKRHESLTLEHLNKLGVFDFVSLSFTTDTADGKNLLRANIVASPRPKNSLRSEVVLTTTSTNFTGPGLELSYTNRNLFQGAEQLRLSAIGRYEQQLTGSRKGLTSYEIDLSADLLFPRVSGPFRAKKLSGNLPRTKYSINYRLFDQPDYYAQSNFGLSYGYEWLSNENTFHDLKLLRLDYVRLLRSSDRLEDLFDRGTLERESFNDQFIFGPSYSVTYSPQRGESWANYYLGGSIEFSGNLLYGAYSLTDAKENENDQYEVVGVPFAQYSRAQLDGRLYLDVAEYTQLVLRQNVGVGLPYLNSNSLPFAKQFFVGGASSIRGFQPRAVGPGSYLNAEGNEDSFFDQTGDIMLEWNAETRFDLGGYLNGALFVDAGNVWLINESPSRPGGSFAWKDFMDEIALSAGVGLRIDIEFIIIRFDLALPLRDPSFEKGDRWLFDEIAWDNSWVGDNLILNFAIGYPF